MPSDIRYNKIKNGSVVTKKTKNMGTEEDDDFENLPAREKWTARKKMLLVSVSLVAGLAYGNLSSIMPYFPNVGQQMGISKTVIGFVFSSGSLIGVFVSAFSGFLLEFVSPKVVFTCALFVSAVTQILFGLGRNFPAGSPFLAWTFVTRLITAAGGILAHTTLTAVLPQEFTTDFATAMGVTEVFSGVGLAGTPALAGVIYQHGGYFWPSASLGILTLVAAVLILAMFWNTEFERPEQTVGFLQKSLKLLKNPMVLISVESAFVASTSFTVSEPIYAIFGYKVLGLNATKIGLLYSPLWISYLIVSGIVGKVLDKIGRHILILVIGFAISAIGFVLLGPDPLLKGIVPEGTIWLTVIAELCIGVGLGTAYIPPLPYMLESIRGDNEKVDPGSSNILSGLFFSSVCLGVFAGPTLSGILADYLSVESVFAVFGYVGLVQAVILIIYSTFHSCS